MSKFKKGDKVRCVLGYENCISQGTVYEVLEDTEFWVRVVSDQGEPGGYKQHRFEIVTPTPAYSVHNESAHGMYCGDYFTIAEATTWIQENGTAGETYTVVERIERRRFEVVEKVQRELKAL